MKGLLFIIFLSFSFTGFAQPSDVIQLRRKDRPVRTYFAGDQISFTTKSGAFRNALITDIRKDSIYLQEFRVQQVMMTYGGFVLDTLGSFRYAYHYAQIHSFGKEQKGFNILNSGAALFGGGTVITVASLVVLAADREKFSGSLMAAGAGAAILGYFMLKNSSKPIIVGKKHFNIEYINMQNEKSAAEKTSGN